MQVYLSQSEEDRDAAEQRASEALSKLAAAEQVVASFDGKLEDAANQAVADLEVGGGGGRLLEMIITLSLLNRHPKF